MRVITSSKFNAHTEPLFKLCRILKFSDLFTSCVLRFAFKVLNGLSPYYFCKVLINDVQNDEYITRSTSNISNKIKKYVCRTSNAKYCIRNELPCVLNTVPCIVTDKIFSHSYQGFKLYVKNHFIDQYQETCTLPLCYVCQSNR